MTCVLPEEDVAPGPDADVSLFGVRFSSVSLQEAVDQILQCVAGESEPERRTGCRYIVTPNVSHVVKLQEDARFREAYAAADFVLADGWPIVALSRVFRRPLPERVAGSDLVPELFAAASSQRPLSVFLLGGAEGVAKRAAERIMAQWPSVRVTGYCSPPRGFEQDPVCEQRILEQVAATEPDFVIVALGAPRQEIWTHRMRHRLRAKVALCGGATIDFLAGEKSRAPIWMRRNGLEWLYRIALEPRRLTGRYVRDALLFPKILWKQWCGTYSSESETVQSG